MADVSKCIGKYCVVKLSCRRYTDNENQFRQSWIEQPKKEKDGSCQMYYENNLTDSQKQMIKYKC